MAELLASRIRKLFNYDHETGQLIWRDRELAEFQSTQSWRTWNSRYSGKAAGSYTERLNCIVLGINGKSYKAHRVVWIWHYGEWPRQQIDHINGDGRDNRIENLRDVSCSENHKNMPVNQNSRSGIIGVRLHKDGAWVAEIKVGEKYVHLGSYSDIRLAAAARKAAEKVLGYHENHGRPSQVADRRTA